MGFHRLLKRTDRRALVAAMASTLALVAPDAWAQASGGAASNAQSGVLDEIIVTARKVSESLQSVPSSVSALSAEDLRAAGVNAVADVISSLPNVSFGGGIAGSLQGQLGIRGISTLQRNIGVESGVGIYVDGVYQGRSDNYNQELIDVDRIEVLRGPQGTLFGKNTIAGVFNITTLKPGDETTGQVRAEAGNYGLFRTQAYVTGPLSDNLGAKLSVGYVNSDGTYKNLSGGKDGDAADLASLRAGLYYHASDRTDFAFAADGLRDRGRPAFFQVTDLAGVPDNPMATRPRVIDPDGQDFLHRNNYGLSLTATHDLGFANLTSISAFRRSHYDASLDDDQSQISLLSKDVFADTTKFFTQELRLDGEIGPHLRYVTGLYYLHQKVDTSRELDIGAGFGIPGNPALLTIGFVKADSYAAFGNVDYDLAERLTLSVGARYDTETKRVAFDQIDVNGVFAFIGLPSLTYARKVTDRSLSPTGSLRYEITPDVSTYARISKGFKSSGFNVDLVSSTRGLDAGPETAVTYEVGLKSELFGRRLRANFALFDTQYDDLQVSQLLGGGVTLDNAGSATIRGAEAELVGYITPNLKASGSVGLLDPTYDRYPNCAVPLSLGGGSTDCSGNQIVGAPKFTRAAALEYTHALSFGDLTGRVEYEGASGVFEEATNSARFRTTAHDIINVRLQLSVNDWDVTLWSKNLFNQVYTTYHDDRSAIGVRQTTAYGDPRTYGLTIARHF